MGMPTQQEVDRALAPELRERLSNALDEIEALGFKLEQSRNQSLEFKMQRDEFERLYKEQGSKLSSGRILLEQLVAEGLPAWHQERLDKLREALK